MASSAGWISISLSASLKSGLLLSVYQNAKANASGSPMRIGHTQTSPSAGTIHGGIENTARITTPAHLNARRVPGCP